MDSPRPRATPGAPLARQASGGPLPGPAPRSVEKPTVLNTVALAPSFRMSGEVAQPEGGRSRHRLGSSSAGSALLQRSHCGNLRKRFLIHHPQSCLIHVKLNPVNTGPGEDSWRLSGTRQDPLGSPWAPGSPGPSSALSLGSWAELERCFQQNDKEPRIATICQEPKSKNP